MSAAYRLLKYGPFADRPILFAFPEMLLFDGIQRLPLAPKLHLFYKEFGIPSFRIMVEGIFLNFRRSRAVQATGRAIERMQTAQRKVQGAEKVP